MESKKFDYVVGNPPYLKNTYIDFFKKALELGSEVVFVTPNKWTTQVKQTPFRKLLSAYKVAVVAIPWDWPVFGKILRGEASYTYIKDGAGWSMTVGGYTNFFQSETYAKNALPKFKSTEQKNQYESDAERSLLECAQAPCKKYEDQWRITFKQAFVGIKDHCIVEPGTQLGPNDCVVPCSSERNALAVSRWLNTPLAADYWDAFDNCRHVPAKLRFIPRPPHD